MAIQKRKKKPAKRRILPKGKQVVDAILSDGRIICPCCGTSSLSDVIDYGLTADESLYWYTRQCKVCVNVTVKSYSTTAFEHVDCPKALKIRKSPAAKKPPISKKKSPHEKVKAQQAWIIEFD